MDSYPYFTVHITVYQHYIHKYSIYLIVFLDIVISGIIYAYYYNMKSLIM